MHNRIVRTLIVAAGLIVASTAAFASKGDCDHASRTGYETERGARFEKHMTTLHDALKLTSAQEPAWTEFSGKIKPVKSDNPNMDKTGHPDWKEIKTPDRLDRVLDHMKSREQRLTEDAAAVRTFYGALTPEQQNIFDHRFLTGHDRNGGYSRDNGYAM